MNAERKNWLRQRIDAGLKAAVATALEEHRRAGRLVAIFRDGKVVLVRPEPQPTAETRTPRKEQPRS